MHQTQTQATKPRNRLFQAFPNLYIPFRDPWGGNTDSDESDPAAAAALIDTVTMYYNLADGNGDQTIDMTLNTVNDATQFDVTGDGYYVGPTGNTVYCAYLVATAANLGIFTEILHTTGRSSLFCFRLRGDGAPSSSARIMHLWDGTQSATDNANQPWAFRHQNKDRPTMELNTNAGANNDSLTAPLGTDPSMNFFHVDRLSPQLKTAANYPTGSTVKSGQTQKTTSGAAQTSAPTAADAQFTVMARGLTGTTFSNFGVDVSMSDIRIINFQGSPPTDIDAIQEYLSVNMMYHVPPGL